MPSCRQPSGSHDNRPGRGSPAHREAAVEHALRRLFQRFGIACSMAEYAAMNAEVRDGRARRIAETRRGPIYEIAVRGRTVYAGWSGDADTITTFMPKFAKVQRALAAVR